MTSALERWMADCGRACEARDTPAFVAPFVMQVTLDAQGLCTRFREWWHTNET